MLEKHVFFQIRNVQVICHETYHTQVKKNLFSKPSHKQKIIFNDTLEVDQTHIVRIETRYELKA